MVLGEESDAHVTVHGDGTLVRREFTIRDLARCSGLSLCGTLTTTQRALAHTRDGPKRREINDAHCDGPEHQKSGRTWRARAGQKQTDTRRDQEENGEQKKRNFSGGKHMATPRTPL